MLYSYGLMSTALTSLNYKVLVGTSSAPFHNLYNFAEKNPAIKLPDPNTTQVSGLTSGVDFLPAGTAWFAVNSSTVASARLRVYGFDGSNSTLLNAPNVNLPGNGRGVKVRPQGDFVAIAHSASPFLSVYEFDGVDTTKIPNPVNLPNFDGLAVDWFPSGLHVFIGGSSGRFRVYSFDAVTQNLTLLPGTVTTAPGIVYKVRVHPDGDVLAVVHDDGNFVSFYSFNGVDIALMPNSVNFSLNNGVNKDLAFDPTGQYFAVVGNTTPFIKFYKYDKITAVQLPNPSILPPSGRAGVFWVEDGKYIVVVGAGSAPRISFYSWNYTTETATFVGSANIDLSGSGTSVNVSPVTA
jgi:WD40 repeat protein